MGLAHRTGSHARKNNVGRARTVNLQARRSSQPMQAGPHARIKKENLHLCVLVTFFLGLLH